MRFQSLNVKLGDNYVDKHRKQVGYFYDKHGRVKTKTLTPVDKDGEPLRDFFRICVTAIKVKDKVPLYHRIQS